jgi:dethiobiotin synthetase
MNDIVFCPVHLHEFHILESLEDQVFVILTASWIKFSFNHFTSILQFIPDYLLADLKIFYVLITRGDDEIEDLFINKLEVNSLPSLVCISNRLLKPKLNEQIFMTAHHPINQTNGYLFTARELFLEHHQVNSSHQTSPLKLFVSGDKANVGKTSICLSILAALIEQGIPPSSIAYIKPVTQSEVEQPISRFCKELGITERGIGPVVFYRGFTRAFLAGETETRESLMNQIVEAVTDIGRDKIFTLIDGVGYPSVGSICNISNADVAYSCQAPVLLVGKSGVGDAVDSHNLNSAYFELHRVKVLGAIFNKLSTDESNWYNLQNCKMAVESYFSQFRRNQVAYGFVPQINLDVPDYEYSNDHLISAFQKAGSNSQAIAAAVQKHVKINTLFRDIFLYSINIRQMNLNSLIENNCSYTKLSASSAASSSSCVSTSSFKSLPNHGINVKANFFYNDKLTPNNRNGIQSEHKFQAESKNHQLKSVIGQKRKRNDIELEAEVKGAVGG